MRQDLRLDADQLGWVHRLEWKATLHAEHCHDELEANVIERGHATYLVDGHAVELGPGDLVWLHPNQHHILINQSRDILAWIVVLKPAVVAELANDLPDGAQLAQPSIDLDTCRRRLTKPDFSLCRRLLADIAELPAQAYTNHSLPALFARLWLAHQRGDQLPMRTLDGDIRAAKEAIDRDPVACRRADLAAQLGSSPASLSRRFRQQTGQSLTDYRNHIRLMSALSLLAHTDDPVVDVAFSAGFGSYPQFHRVFQERLATSPAAWRSDHR